MTDGNFEKGPAGTPPAGPPADKEPADAPYQAIRAIPVRHYGRWIAAVVVVVFNLVADVVRVLVDPRARVEERV